MLLVDMGLGSSTFNHLFNRSFCHFIQVGRLLSMSLSIHHWQDPSTETGSIIQRAPKVGQRSKFPHENRTALAENLPISANWSSLIALALSASARCPHVSGSSLNFSLAVIISLRQAPWSSLFLDFISSNSSPGMSSSIPRSYHLSLIGYRKPLRIFREIASAIHVDSNCTGS